LSLPALLVLSLQLFSTPASAYNNPTLEWRTIKTEHFEVHYHEGAEWTARQVAEVAEEVHGPLCELYGHEPDLPVHFIIRDTDDYANGAAYFYDNKVEIWATNLEFGYRGTTQWLRNVVTHEYGHIVSIQAAMKTGRRFPALYFQLISFEEEKRPDVLQGYPKDIVTYPLSGLIFPPWFAEGVSQFQTADKKYDCWDTHRDMILRCGVLEDKMLTYDEMGFFGKNSMKGEQVYDHGFGMVNYIASEYGPDAITRITKELKAPLRLNADGAFKNATGKTGLEIYDDWKAHLRRVYDAQADEIRKNPRDGAALLEAGEKNGFMNVWPVFSPDGKRIAVLSNKGSDYAGTSLFVMNRDGTDPQRIKAGVSSRPAFSADGKRLLYSRKQRVDRYGSTVNDLFVYDLDKRKEKRLTRGSRISDPDFSPDGRTIVGVKNADGTHRIVIVDAEGAGEKKGRSAGAGERELYAASMGTQFYNPRFSPDGREVLFGIFDEGTRDIAAVSADGLGFRYLLRTPNDERDGSWTRDGKGIVFSSDRTGVFNVYRLDLESGGIEQYTNVIGGAFAPDRSADGAIVYSRYCGDGYGIHFVHPSDGALLAMDGAAYAARDVTPFDACAFLKSRPDVPGGVPEAAKGGPSAAPDVQTVPAFESARYKSTYTSFGIYPRVVIWDGTPRFGLSLTSDEILEKQSLFASGSYGTNNEYDGYIGYEIRNFYPTIFADFVVMKELYPESGSYEDDLSTFTYNFDIEYDLWQANLGLKLELSERYSLHNFHQLSAYWSHGEYRVHIEGKEYRDGEYNAFIKGGWKYFIGNEGILEWTLRKLAPAVDTDINPRGGRQIRFEYLRAYDKLFTTGEFEYGFQPKYADNNFNRYTIDWREYVGLPYLRHSLRLRLYASVIDRTVDDFFWTYVGGRDGIRGYTYYTLGGKKAALGSLTYRFPVWRNINEQFLHLYFRDLYGGVFFETANAWSTRGFETKGYKNSVGFDLRLSLGSFYLYPVALSWTAAYSLDPVENVLYGFSALPVVIRQEKGWSHYLTMGFGFDL
jgi:Tol biopolymer transport system component